MTNLKKYIREVKDWPKPGVTFLDIAPILANPKAFKEVIMELSLLCGDFDKIVAPDARGFIFGMPLAYETKKPFVMVRKPGKLPGETLSQTYELEYGTDKLEMQQDAIKPGDRVIIIDDILATGGTVNAIKKLVEKQGAEVLQMLFVIELEFLNGKAKIEIDPQKITSLVKY